MTTDWTKLRVVDLKEELKRRGLPPNGLKVELVARLTEAENQPAQDESTSKNAPVAEDSPATEPLPEAEASEGTVEEFVEDASPGKEPRELKEDEDLSLTAEAEEGENKEAELPEVTENDVADDSHPAPIAGQAAETQSIEPTTTTDEAMQYAVDETNADEEPTASQTMDTQTEQTPEAQDSQKRKRRSLTPPPSEETIARKRVRPNDNGATNGGIAPQVFLPEDQKLPQVESQPEDMIVDVQTTEKQPHDSNTHETRGTRDSPPPTKPRDFQQEMDFERDAVPSVHPTTPALYIKNFMRPLRPNEVQAHLADLATRGEDTTDDDIIVDFFLDQIRTHAFVVFKSTSAASRVRAALHDKVWPNESNRKPLWVDFVPREKVHDWIDKEESGGRRGPRWEVVYEDGPNGEIEAHLESGTASISRQGNRPPPGPTSNTADASIPLGPRGPRDVGAPPTGPRAVRPGSGPGPRPPPLASSGDSQRTRTHPVIYYQVVSDDLARRRIENMRSFYSTEHDRDLGRDINRYSFESGDAFVDRGKEIFEGIRPPHRERNNFDRDRRGFGGGGGGRRGRGGRGRGGGGGGGGSRFGSRSDRYMPGGGGSGRDDRRPR